MNKIFLLFVLTFTVNSIAQVVTTQPEYPTEQDSIVVFLDATQPGAEELLNYTGTVYAHTGVNTNLGTWQHVIGDWGNNQNQPALTRLSTNMYKLTIGFPRIFYSITNPAEIILEMNFVFRSADGSLQTRPDIFVPLYEAGLNILIRNPEVSVEFGDPLRSPVFLQEDSSVTIDVKVIELGTVSNQLSLYINDVLVNQTNEDSLLFTVNYSDYPPGALDVDAIAVDTSGATDTTTFVLFVNPLRVNQAPPPGTEPGINYNSATSVTLMLQAPDKNFVYILGDFNDWNVGINYFLNRYATGAQEVFWWITLNSVSPGTEYAFQYLVDGEIRIGDPFTEKILDPWNDEFILNETYPNLKPYPDNKTDYPVSIFQTGISPYVWQNPNFEKPPKEKLVVYELLMRDFLTAHDFKTLKDTLNYLKLLGVNAIELMPIMEFEGNTSWGYNPMFHLAPDKYYGPSNTLKQFIDEAHGMGIAVILDMVLNHAFGQSPLVRLYWDEANNRPAANNPWFNQIPKHPFNVGYDFNHESNATKYFVDRVNRFWLEEYNFDGFRFDLSKGFTQFNSGNDVNLWSQYDQSRIDILKRMADSIWAAVPDAYVILEHFAVNSEETVLSDYGMMIWGNMNHEYNEATMGYPSNLSGATHNSRGWDDLHLISYMESHDEERLMYKNLQFGNSSGNYDVKNFPIAIQRIKLASAFYFTIPGPKMIWQFGELGYDFSINYPCGTDQCRLDPKPIRWDYFNDGNRKNLYKVFQAIIKLKSDYPAFSSTNYNYSLSSLTKRLTILDSTMNVNIVGNFNVTQMNMNPQFPNTGWWFDYFSGDSINVMNTQDQISLDPGEFHIYTTVKLPTPEEGILLDVEKTENKIVTEYSLEQNYPNPFNPSTKIKFRILDFGFTTLKIYDILGNEVATLVNEELAAGEYEVEFTGHSDEGQNLSSGVYFYGLQVGEFTETKKMILLK